MAEDLTPPNISAEYSGPGADDRDPKLVGALIPEFVDELVERAANAAVLTARQRFLELDRRQAGGEDVSDELREARNALLAIEEQRRILKPPQE